MEDLPKLDRIDRFGQCCSCTRHLITKKVIDGKVQEVFVPEFGSVEFLLNNGSKMGVTICKICQNSYDFTDPNAHKEIMDAVYKGWELETKELVEEGKTDTNGNFIKWSKEFRDKHLITMAKLSIDCRADGVNDNVIFERSQKLGKEFFVQVDKNREIKNSEEVEILEITETKETNVASSV